MKTTFAIRHAEDESKIRAHFDDRVQKLEKYLVRFKDDLIYLHGDFDKNPHKEEFYASLSLYLPAATMHCRERGEDFTAAINAAFLDLARQIRKHNEKLGREKRRRVR